MTIQVGKSFTRRQLDKALAKLRKKYKGINLDKYFGKIRFGMTGFEYQKTVRDEWR